MREIKFRAWDKQFKKMSPVKELNLSNGVCIIFNDPNPGRFLGSFEIMQYTGLLDKNGKEIYEGDILLYEGDSCKHCGKPIYGEHKPYRVEWCDYGWDAINKENSISPTCWQKEIKIIGNVHENPELLTEV